MTDLEINIAVVKAMGWVDVDISASFCGKALETYDQHKGYWRRFDYRDPVIFVAICKHWGLVVNFSEGFASGVDEINIVGEWEKPRFIEKAVALVVIELAKRGVK